MTMGVTKLVAGTSSNYFTETASEVSVEHGGGMAGYYNAPGTPAGIWMGTGLAQYGLTAGSVATKQQVSRLYDALRHPLTGSKLSRMSDESIAAGKVVGGYDLTFTLPKSVNILWAAGDEHVRKTIMQAHKESIADTVQWFEQHAAYSRSGNGGAVVQRVHGVTAVSFTHWDTRDHDPHLHDHLLVSNMVRRADGKIGTLDGRSVFKAAVAMSERHTNLFMDKLTDRLGVQWYRRTDLDSKASVYEIQGIDETLIASFSQRHNQLANKRDRLVQEAQSHGQQLTPGLMNHIDAEAWRETRKAKPKTAKSLHMLMDTWQREMRQRGTDPCELVERVTGNDYSTFDIRVLHGRDDMVQQVSALLDQSLRDVYSTPVSQTLHTNVKGSRTTISEYNVIAEAKRLARGVRMSAGQSDVLTDMLTSIELSRLVELTPQRYQLSDSQRRDAELSGYHGRAVTDNREGSMFATRELLDAEKAFTERANAVYEPASQFGRSRVREEVGRVGATMKHPLADDQATAAVSLLCDKRMIIGLDGAAGTGKTTTLKAVVDTVTGLQGEGMVLGLSPTAVAAGELKKSLGISTETVAKILYEARTGHTDGLLAAAEQRLRDASSLASRQAAREEIASLSAQKQRMQIPQGGYVIVDEAGMADTMTMSHLSQLCQARHAKMIMVGDDMQLSSPGEGNGAFAWLVDHQHTVELTSVWRFSDPQEAERSQLLRNGVKDPLTGEYRAVQAYESAGRVHAVRDIDAEDVVVARIVDDITNHVDSVLSVSTNDELAQLNERISKARQDLGQVDANEAGRVRLQDGSTAGAGDIICTRRNNRSLTTSTGASVRNNDMWVVDQVNPDGALVCHGKYETGETITLPRSYVDSQVIGGYALTAQRAQGRTVTRAYTYVPVDTDMSRAALYVAMSRGRESNEVYVGVTDPLDMQTVGVVSKELAWWRQRNRPEVSRHGQRMEWTGEGQPPDREHWYTADELLPTDAQQAHVAMNRMLDDKGVTRFAGEWAEDYRQSMNGIEHISQEYHYYARVLARRRLEEKFDTSVMQRLSDDPQFDRMVEAYSEASLLDARKADMLVKANMNVDATSVADLLNREINDHDRGRGEWLANRYTSVRVAESESQQVKDAADLVNQSYTKMQEQLATRVARAGEHGSTPAWTYKLGSTPGEGTPRRAQWDELVGMIAAYRAEHHIDDVWQPLGKATTDTHSAWRDRLSQSINAYRHPQASETQIPGVATDVSGAGVSGGKMKALSAGRDLFVDTTREEPSMVDRGYVRVESRNVAASITRARTVNPASTQKIMVRVNTDSERAQVWNSLSMVERARAQEIGKNHEIRPLYVSMAEQSGIEPTIRGLQVSEQQQARRVVEREAAQNASLSNLAGLSPDASAEIAASSLSLPPVEVSGPSEPAVQGPALSGA